MRALRFAIGQSALFALVGCAFLGEVETNLEGREAPSFLYFSSDQRIRAGVGANLPLRLAAPSEVTDILGRCGMQAIAQINKAFVEPALNGTWFSRRLWIRTDDASFDQFRQFPDLSKLASIGHTFVSIRLEAVALEVLDPIETTFDFLKAHDSWKPEKFVKHFEACLPKGSRGEILIVHQALRAKVFVQFNNFFGFPIWQSNSLDQSMLAIGFTPGKCKREYESVAPWAIVRSSRLRLSSNGFFRSPSP